MINEQHHIHKLENAADSLIHIPSESRTYGVCLAAVQENGCALEYVPEKLKTPELCLAAARVNGYSLKYVPESLKTPGLCLAAAVSGSALEHVPRDLMTEEMCLASVRAYGHSLEDVPYEFKTSRVCLEAVRENPFAIRYVPTELLTREICFEAVKLDGFTFELVPDEFKTADLCLEVARRDGHMLKCVPMELRTPELCLAAVKSSFLAFAHVPQKSMTVEICFEAVKRDADWDIVPAELKAEVETKLLEFNAVMEAAYEKETFLFDLIKKAAEECGPLEPVNRRIDREISLAAPISFDGLAALRPKDGDNFVVSVDRDTEVDPSALVFRDKKITVTIRGSGRLGTVVEDIIFPGGGDTVLDMGDGTVLILENVVLKSKKFIFDCIVQVNGGVLVFKHGAIINEAIMGGTNQGLSGFVSGRSVSSMYCDVVGGNDEGIVYNY